MKFTDRQIKALKPRKERYEVWETNGKGFGVRVSSTGRKSFIFLYKFQGTSRRITFGNYPEMSLADAHAAHAKSRQLLEQGSDPATVEQDEKEESRRSPSVKRLVAEYIEKYAKPRKRSWKEDERILYKDVVPRWGKRKAQDVTRRDIILLLDEIVERGALIQANRTLATIRKMYSFAMGRGILESSPCVAIPAPSKENRRDRVLSEDEVKIFWEKLATAKMEKATALALKLQLITAQRKGEVAGSEWADFDFKNGWWTIPAEKSKNGLPHRVPLSSFAIETLNELKIISGDSKWLFPSPRDGQHIAETSVDHAVRANAEYFKIDHFTPHDLRRTAASMMTASGIQRLTVAKVLNHVESGVTAVYDRHSYDKEKQKGLRSWGRQLEAILGHKTSSKVIPIRNSKMT
jgi:integrase